MIIQYLLQKSDFSQCFVQHIFTGVYEYWVYLWLHTRTKMLLLLIKICEPTKSKTQKFCRVLIMVCHIWNRALFGLGPSCIVVNINITTLRGQELFPSSGKISEKLARLGPALGYGDFPVGPNWIGVPWGWGTVLLQRRKVLILILNSKRLTTSTAWFIRKSLL